MHEPLEVVSPEATQRLDDANALVRGRREDLSSFSLTRAVDRDEVGVGATDVDADPDTHAVVLRRVAVVVMEAASYSAVGGIDGAERRQRP